MEGALIQDDQGNVIKLSDQKHQELIKMIKEAFGTEDIRNINPNEIPKILQ